MNKIVYLNILIRYPAIPAIYAAMITLTKNQNEVESILPATLLGV